MLVGAPVIAKPARRGLKATDFLEVELDHVGKFKILEKEVEHFLARQHEAEIVLGFASRLRTPCRSRHRPGPAWDAVARHELLVARQDIVRSAAAWSRAGSSARWCPSRHRHDVSGVDVGDLAGLDLVIDGSLQFLARTPQKALPVAQAFVLRDSGGDR